MGIVQTRILEWVAIPFSGDLSNSGTELRSLALQTDSLSLSHQEWIYFCTVNYKICRHKRVFHGNLLSGVKALQCCASYNLLFCPRNSLRIKRTPNRCWVGIFKLSILKLHIILFILTLAIVYCTLVYTYTHTHTHTCTDIGRTFSLFFFYN